LIIVLFLHIRQNNT